MPHFSERYHRLRKLRKHLQMRIHMRNIRELNQSTNDGLVILEDDEDVEHLDRFVCFQYIFVSSNCFYAKRTYCRRPFDQFSEDLGSNLLTNGDPSSPEVHPFLNPNEFLTKYRMSREKFNELVLLIENHNVFKRGERGRSQESPVHQLMVLLRYLASEGNGGSNPNLRNIFKIGRGTSDLYKKRCVIALCSLKDKFYFWPDANERHAISERIRRKFLFPNCVIMIDGTLNGLATRPQCNHASDYHGRKLPYSMSTTIVCDDKRKICYYLAGWPGSTHHSRVFKNSALFLNHAHYFGATQYLLGDSAYEPLPFLVPAYKKPQGHTICREKENFNKALSKPRVFFQTYHWNVERKIPMVANHADEDYRRS